MARRIDEHAPPVGVRLPLRAGGAQLDGASLGRVEFVSGTEVEVHLGRYR